MPRKTDYFAKFAWPRVSTPHLDFSLPELERTRAVIEKEQQVETQIQALIQAKGVDIAAILIEPIQGEGGDNHFRAEWLRTLRRLCDENEILLIFDEVQCGMGATGRNWCCEHFDVLPDLLAFGKKSQICGVMAGPRLDEVSDNCFRLPGRISSTWGGNLTDMVRSTVCLEIIERERLVENAGRMGECFLEELRALAAEEPVLTAVRGRGLVLAFDLPDREMRECIYKALFEIGLLAIRSGERSIRFRPALDLPLAAVHSAMEMLRESFRRLKAGVRARSAESAKGKL